MKLFFLVIIFSFFMSGCGSINPQAQLSASNNSPTNSKASKTGLVVQSNVSQSTPNRNTFDLSTIDFKNFTFPDFGAGQSEKTFTLINAKAESKDGLPKLTLRKTYYFDLTG